MSRSTGATSSAGRRRVVIRNVDSELDSRCISSSSSRVVVLSDLLRSSRGTPMYWYSCANMMPSRRLSVFTFGFSLIVDSRELSLV